MAQNPNPARISDPMWRFWEDFKAFESSAKLGGIFADKPGYHNRRNDLPKSDYSVEDLADDRLGPADKASAWDLTLPEAEMKIYTKRLVDACKRRDPRLFKDGKPIIREVIGTLDGSTVYCYVLTGGRPLGVGGDSGPDPGRDKTHLWHIHISLIRRFINDWQAISGILSILKGESLDDWSEDVSAKDVFEYEIYNPVTKTKVKFQTYVQSINRDVYEQGQQIDKLTEQVNKLAATPPGTVVITDEQLERVLRKVIGSVDQA